MHSELRFTVIGYRVALGSPIQIHISIGITIAAQNLTKADRMGGMARAREDDIAEIPCDQHEPAEQKSPKQDLAELVVACNQSMKILR